MRALDRAIAHETTAKYLPEEVFIHALLAHFGLLTQMRDFHRALEAFESLSAFEIDEETRAALQADAEQIRILKTDDRAYSVAGEIDDTANWYFDLFKDDFAVLDVHGEIAEVKLRCDRKYVFFRFDPAIAYHVNDTYGDCHLTPGRQPGNDIPAKKDVGTGSRSPFRALYKLHCGPGARVPRRATSSRTPLHQNRLATVTAHGRESANDPDANCHDSRHRKVQRVEGLPLDEFGHQQVLG